MFDDENELFLDIQNCDVLLEVREKQQEIKGLSDQKLVEEASDLMMQLNFGQEADLHIDQFFKNDSLSERGRKVLEGTYILYHTNMAINVDSGDIMISGFN